MTVLLLFFFSPSRSLRRCRLERIESGTFRAMQNLTSLWAHFPWLIRHRYTKLVVLERLGVTFTANGIREFETLEQIFSCTCCKYREISRYHASFVHTNCSELLLSTKFQFWEFLNLNLLRFTVCRKSDFKSLYFCLKWHRPNVSHS